MGVPIVAGDDLDIPCRERPSRSSYSIPRIWELDVPIVVRQLVFPRPACDLFGLTIRSAVAVLLPSIALVEEALIIALELVVESDAAHPSTSASQALVGALVGAIDLGVVRQLARLPEAGVEGLARLVRAVVAFATVGLEEVPAALSQDDGAVVRAERIVRMSPSFSRCSRLRRELCESSRRSSRSLSATTRNAPTVASARPSVPSIS